MALEKNFILYLSKLTPADKAANRENGFGYTINIINSGNECSKGTATSQAFKLMMSKSFAQSCALHQETTSPALIKNHSFRSFTFSFLFFFHLVFLSK